MTTPDRLEDQFRHHGPPDPGEMPDDIGPAPGGVPGRIRLPIRPRFRCRSAGHEEERGGKGEETGDGLRGRRTGGSGNHTSWIRRHRSNMSLHGIVSPTFSYRKTSGIKTGVPGSSAARVRRHRVTDHTAPGRRPRDGGRPSTFHRPDAGRRAVRPILGHGSAGVAGATPAGPRPGGSGRGDHEGQAEQDDDGDQPHHGLDGEFLVHGELLPKFWPVHKRDKEQPMRI